jgi:hypothetical protein
MSTLELPTDVAHKIMGMLKPKARPYAVLMVAKHGDAMIKKGSITPEEEAFLFDTYSARNRSHYLDKYIIYSLSSTDFLGYNALSLEFRFLNEEARTRWQKGEPFEMYRDAVYGIA